MDSSPRVPPQEFAVSMRAEFDQLAEEVMKAVNEAPDFQWIAGSEEKVRDLCAAMRRRVFERAVQKRVQAAEAAFPPSTPCDDGKAIRE